MPGAPPQRPGNPGSDTPETVLEHQVEILRSLSSVEIAAIINGASRAARTIAFARLRSRHPGASGDELVARLAWLTLDADLSYRAYLILAELHTPSGP